MLAAGSAASLAALLIWLGPPGNDLAAHVYQRTVFLHDGFQLWNNFWYGGRYSFVTYSVLYYPLAGVLGIKPLAVVWAGLVISAAFPFALGIALGLLSIWALQAGKRWRFGVLAVLTAAASPLAFLLLAVFLAGIALGMQDRGRRVLAPALIVVGVGVTEFLLARAFSDGGHYPFSLFELSAVLLFCGLGAALTWHVDTARTLRWFFVAYAVTCGVAFAVASPLGENVARVRFA